MDKILKLAKRLNKFTLDEIASISEVEESELAPILENSEQIKKSGTVYLYIPAQKTNPAQNTLLPKLQYHTPETIDMIVKCFCAEIEVNKAIKILRPQKDCITKFYKSFRECLYRQQYQELVRSFKENPKVPKERTFYNKTVYLYLYDNKLFISLEPLKTSRQVMHTTEETKKLKALYSKIRRRLDTNWSYEHYFYHHIAEIIWRDEKNYEQLLVEIYVLLDFSI